MNPARILIVDDEEKIRLMVRTCLQSGGYDLLEAANGLEAVDKVRGDDSIDLVLLDLAMPVMDGMAALVEIRPMQQQPPVRVIVMTAHGSIQTAIKALRLGASDFLEKPFVPEDLRLSVASVLEEVPLWLQQAGDGYDDVLRHTRDALRQGKFSTAEALLMKAGVIADDDPAFLNLAGVLHEAHGRLDGAKRFYEKAIARDGRYLPAMQNQKRLEEIRRRGKSVRGVALGDEIQNTTPAQS